MPRHCYVLRVFTRGADGGNPLGVVTDSSGLSSATMQEIATELGFSETIYLNWDDPELPRVRIFTPASELPFAGHPLVGMTWLLHQLGPGGCEQLECGIGRVAIRLDGEMAWVDAPGGQPVALGRPLEGYDPGADPLSSAVVEMPLPYHVIELPDSAAVAIAAILVARGRPRGSVTLLQGEEMGARSSISMHWDESQASIGGTVVRDEVRWLEY